MAIYLGCAACGLLILGMSANEWRSLRTSSFVRLAAAGAFLLLARSLGLLALAFGLIPAAACPEWALEGLTLTVFAWATVWREFYDRGLALSLSMGGAIAVVGSLILCLVSPAGLAPALSALPPGLIVVSLLSGAALAQWLVHRQRSSLWLGGGFLLSLLAAGAGLFGLRQVALVGHLAALSLFVIETYRAVLTGWSARVQEHQTAHDRALHQTQEMALLLEASQSISASLDLPVILERASETVAEAIDADWAYFLLPAEDDLAELTVAARYGWWGRRKRQDAQLPRQVAIRPADFTLLRHAILRRRQVLANEPKDYEQFERLHDLLGRPQSGPTLIQPICLQDRVLGVVLLGHVGRPQTFSEADSKLCQALVAQVATAIGNIRLYQNVDGRARELSRLLSVQGKQVIRQQAILEAIADGVVVAGESGELILANAAAERILGGAQQEAMGQAIWRWFADCSRSGDRKPGDRGVLKYSGKVIEGSLAPIEMPDGGRLGCVAVFRDVTASVGAEEGQNRLRARVFQELVAGLNSIRAALGRSIGGRADSVSLWQDHLLETARADTERLVSLLNNLILASAMERGAIQIESRPVNMNMVIAEAVRAIRAQAAESQLNLSVNLPPGLRPAWGDPRAVRQILNNLLSNALRFTPAEGRITVWATEAHLPDDGSGGQDYVIVSIRDTGVGIPVEEHDRIFDRFYRGGTAAALDVDGEGVGLAIVKALVQAHGGQLWVESQPGEGSTFSFAIPASQPARGAGFEAALSLE
jgi:two-component system phosphate regulon sensor histidine kinase PhoR